MLIGCPCFSGRPHTNSYTGSIEFRKEAVKCEVEREMVEEYYGRSWRGESGSEFETIIHMYMKFLNMIFQENKTPKLRKEEKRKCVSAS